jgi:aryl-alcohol dehydrogenase-like predicted oxidoreductase
MQYGSLGDLRISRLTLGTVQFGMPYGVANTSGQPSLDAVTKILECAFQAGVNCIDTAAAYGASEEVLGEALARLNTADKTVVVTKIPPMEDSLSADEADTFVEDSVSQSLRRLRLDVLPACIFHREDSFTFVDSLAKVRDKGLVRYIGASTMSPAGALEIVRSGLADAVQVPTSCLDQRYIRAGVFAEAADRGVALFVRSIYLQGLLLMPEQSIPADLVDVIPARRRLEGLAREAGMSLAELAYRCVASLRGTTSVVVGTETVEQARDNLRLAEEGPLDPAMIAAIEGSTAGIPERILMPNLWAKEAT